MRRTSSHYANATTSGPDGPLATGQPSVNTFLGTHWGSRREMNDLQYAFWSARARINHWLGRHSWVPVESWDWIDDHLDVQIQGYICWLCPRRR